MLRGLLVCGLAASAARGQPAPDPQTRAEASGYRQTSSNAEVRDFCERLARKRPAAVRHRAFGTTAKGEPLHLLELGGRKQAPERVVLLMGNIHAGEVDAKEALLMLARDLAENDPAKLLDAFAVLIVPNFNPDGNDQTSAENRTDQNGPSRVGLRANAGGLDLNRDFVKLETPEVRALVRLMNERQPLLAVDGHTTNGSFHRYTLTYDGPRLPAADPALVGYARDVLLPAVGATVTLAAGFDTFTYGDFDDRHQRWLTYGSTPRYGTQMVALRGAFGILSESYTYASFPDRVKASYAFLRGNLEFAREHAETIDRLTTAARRPRPTVAIRTRIVARDGVTTVKGWVEETENGKTRKIGTPRDYDCRLVDAMAPTLAVARPAHYLFPASYRTAADTLRRHGVRVETLREPATLDVEATVLVDVQFAGRAFQNHKLARVEGRIENRVAKVEAGSFVVDTAQPLGQLAAYLLEPLCEDGLTTWNFFDAGLAVGQAHPALRLPKPVALPMQPLPALPDMPAAKRG